jgi:helicase MOV-10
VVGDPDVLGLDPLWRSFLNFVYRNGGWTGSVSRPTWDSSADVEDGQAYDKMVRDAALADMNDFARRMEAMTLSGVVDNGEADEVTVDRPWKEDE